MLRTEAKQKVFATVEYEYEGDLFLPLAWRHGMQEEVGEPMLDQRDTRDLSRTFLVYAGRLSFDYLAVLARESRLGAIRNERNRQQWVENT